MVSMRGKITDKNNKLLVCTRDQMDEYFNHIESKVKCRRVDIDLTELDDESNEIYHWTDGFGYEKDLIWNALKIVKALGYTIKECTYYAPIDIHPMKIDVHADLCFIISPDICIADPCRF